MKEKKAKKKKVWIVQFDFSGETWGIKFEDIQEILEEKKVTPVPKTPPFIMGVIHQRGRVITVIDLALLMGLVPGKDAESKVVFLKNDTMDIGLLVRSKITTELLPEELVETGLMVKEKRIEGRLIITKKIIKKDKTQINLLESDRISEFLDRYPFK